MTHTAAHKYCCWNCADAFFRLFVARGVPRVGITMGRLWDCKRYPWEGLRIVGRSVGSCSRCPVRDEMKKEWGIWTTPSHIYEANKSSEVGDSALIFWGHVPRGSGSLGVSLDQILKLQPSNPKTITSDSACTQSRSLDQFWQLHQASWPAAVSKLIHRTNIGQITLFHSILTRALSINFRPDRLRLTWISF